MKNVLGFLIAMWMISSVATAGSETVTMDKDELRQFIMTVIKENPQLLYDTIDVHIRELKKKNSRKKGFTEAELDSILNQKVKDEVHSYNPANGPEDAPILIIEYTDFQCPYCAKGWEMVQTLMGMFPGKIRHVFKNYPLSPHDKAESAAKAAMAAGKQGKFWEYHDLLFHISPDLGEENLSRFAEELKLDMEQFAKDRDSDEIA
ncbi:MAG: thioredoxin domain-containing protein, partial [bacterium]|nr:thioredoxin domain-containing protein [bacterium]